MKCSIKTISSDSFVIPELSYFFNLSPECCAIKIKIRHAALELALVIPSAISGYLSITASAFFVKIIIFSFRTYRIIRFFSFFKSFYIFSCSFKPIMLWTCMVNYEVHIYINVFFFTCCNELIEIFHSSIFFIYWIIINYIIFMICWWFMERKKPYTVKSEIFNIIEFGCKTIKITYSISITVAKWIYKYLITWTIFIICICRHKIVRI